MGIKKREVGHKGREALRLRAYELDQEGWTQQEIADAVGFSRQTVGKWLRRAKKGGIEALRDLPRSGAPKKLADNQAEELLEMLAKGAQEFGFQGEVWTCRRVAEMIRREFGVEYHPSHVGKLLKSWGWTVQKPVRRAVQRDEAKVSEFLEKTWPALKKRPNKRE